MGGMEQWKFFLVHQLQYLFKMFTLSWIQIVVLVFAGIAIFTGFKQYFREETWKSYAGTILIILLILIIAQS